MIATLNFKPYDKGALRGFFDLRYHGLSIKNCHLMHSEGGLWISLPQQEGKDADGNRKWYDILYLTPPEAAHVRRLVIADLQAQGHVAATVNQHQGTRKASRQDRKQPTKRTPEGEDLTAHYTPANDPHGDIPF